MWRQCYQTRVPTATNYLVLMKTRCCRFVCALAGLSAPAFASTAIVNEINCRATGSTPDGDWFEVVVVGEGTSSSTVDMRGWQFRVDNNGTIQQGYVKLSTDTYWSSVRAGTIITFCEDNTGPTGAATSILGTDNFLTEGWGHTNIWAGDTTYIDASWALNDASFPIDERNTQILIQDSSGATISGPAGEGHVGYPGSGVSATEIFKLEADPSPAITLTSAYNDGSTDTFGRPNEWSSGASKQSFAVFIPEPSVALLALGGMALIGIRRRG